MLYKNTILTNHARLFISSLFFKFRQLTTLFDDDHTLLQKKHWTIFRFSQPSVSSESKSYVYSHGLERDLTGGRPFQVGQSPTEACKYIYSSIDYARAAEITKQLDQDYYCAFYTCFNKWDKIEKKIFKKIIKQSLWHSTLLFAQHVDNCKCKLHFILNVSTRSTLLLVKDGIFSVV